MKLLDFSRAIDDLFMFKVHYFTKGCSIHYLQLFLMLLTSFWDFEVFYIFTFRKINK